MSGIINKYGDRVKTGTRALIRKLKKQAKSKPGKKKLRYQ